MKNNFVARCGNKTFWKKKPQSFIWNTKCIEVTHLNTGNHARNCRLQGAGMRLVEQFHTTTNTSLWKSPMSPQSFTCGRKLCLTRGQKPEVYRSSSPPRHLKSFFFFLFYLQQPGAKDQINSLQTLVAICAVNSPSGQKGPLAGPQASLLQTAVRTWEWTQNAATQPPEAHHCPPGLGLAASAVVGSQTPRWKASGRSL